jgi:hypothetical protein
MKKTNDWLQPDKIDGYNQLQFDFIKIEKMDITHKNTINDEILAYSDNWSITVKDFKNELDKLTPITRLDIVNNNLLREMIEYLAKRNIVFDSNLIINSYLFDAMDLMGKTYDQVNYILKENTIVGTFKNIDLSVNDMRKEVTNLSEYEKNRFLNLSTRKESFDEIMTKKYWLGLYDRKIIEDNPDFKKEITNHQNMLLVELLYKNKIQIYVPPIDDARLNFKMQQAVKSINEDKLFSFIQTVIHDYPIQVNSNYFQNNINLDIETSKYNKVIIKK